MPDNAPYVNLDQRYENAPQRATVYVSLPCDQEKKMGAGTAQIDGPWLHYWPDDPDVPACSFPVTRINAVEWEGDRDAR